MESKAKAFGHPIHPMLVVFPLGLLVSAVLFDWLSIATSKRKFASVGYWNLLAGILGGLVAAPFGLRDYLAIPAGTRAKRVGRLHGILNVTTLLMFGTALWLRRDDAENPSGTVMGVESAAIAAGTIGAWLGGELVDRLGVGVDPFAHLNAPNSLTSDTSALQQSK